jgi:hypothetical protein
MTTVSAYSAIAAVGVTAKDQGKVWCPLCVPPKGGLPKPYAAGQGFRLHLQAKHPSLSADELVQVMRQAEAVPVLASGGGDLKPPLDAGIDAAQRGDLDQIKARVRVAEGACVC